MADTVGAAAQTGANQALQTQDETAEAKSNVNNVAVFTKFIKKAEETAQAAL